MAQLETAVAAATSDPAPLPHLPAATAAAVPSLKLHHVGIAVRSLAEALPFYVEACGFRQMGEPVEVPAQRVRVCFVEAGPGVLLELVEPAGEGSPVDGVLRRSNGGPYHLCYQVDDLDQALERLAAHGCRRPRPFERPLPEHGLRRFAFLLTPDHQVFELCEKPGAQTGAGWRPERRSYNFPTLFFETTRRCNLACSLCMTGSNDREKVSWLSGRELTTDEVERHVLATAKEIGVRTLAWSGGEFLVRRDAVELVRRATAHGYESTVCSNALLVTRERLAELQEASGGSLVMAFGINSIDNESSWTRDADCDPTLEALELCAEMGVRRHVVVNVGRHNLATLDKTLQWLEERGIPYNRSPFTARGSGRDHWEELHFDRRDMEEVIHPALRKHPIGYISYTPFFLSPELHERVSQGQSNGTVPQNPSIGCWCGSWLAVSSEGEVAPCGVLLDEVGCGNVREKTLFEIVDQSPVFQQLLDREQLRGKCGRCRYKKTCGGCRAMAWFESGDLMGEDPTCFFEPADETTVSEHEEETNRMFRRYLFMIRLAERQRAKNSAAHNPAA